MPGGTSTVLDSRELCFDLRGTKTHLKVLQCSACCCTLQAARKDEAKRQAKDKAASAEKLKAAETAAARAREALAAAQAAAKSREAAVAAAQEALAAEKTASAAKDDEVRPDLSGCGQAARSLMRNVGSRVGSAHGDGARLTLRRHSCCAT